MSITPTEAAFLAARGAGRDVSEVNRLRAENRVLREGLESVRDVGDRAAVTAADLALRLAGGSR